MTNLETGKLIASLRKENGMTQKELADELMVTDKAVSKWERGICLPDAALLTKLSMLLDIDIEYLISGNAPYGMHKWCGEIRVEDVKGEISGRPILHFLLSYFMLVGIKDISIITSEIDYVKSLNLSQYGLNISFNSKNAMNTMIVYDKFILFGVSLTRFLNNCIASETNISLTLNNEPVPIAFFHYAINDDVLSHISSFEKRSFSRGMVMLPINTFEQKKDAELFVNIYEKYNNNNIADLNEIAKLRGIT